MIKSTEIDFHRIASRGGGQRDAFEKLVCLLARRLSHRKANDAACFHDYDGSCGDGGVECLLEMKNGDKIGWQAKYVFTPDSLVKQAAQSLKTALKVHPTLRKYYVCFPFIPTGKVAKSPKQPNRKSGWEKLESWKKAAEKDNQHLELVFWSASELDDMLHKYDPSGGVRLYFFDEHILTPSWFSKQLRCAIAKAGPRYSPELHVDTLLSKWMAAFCRTTEWVSKFLELITQCNMKIKVFSKSMPDVCEEDALWPGGLKQKRDQYLQKLDDLLKHVEANIHMVSPNEYLSIIEMLTNLEGYLGEVEVCHKNALSEKYPDENIESVSFRQFQQDYMCSLPTAALDSIRELSFELGKFHQWMESLDCRLAMEKSFILLGEAGSGKTHGICDTAKKLLEDGQYALVLMGSDFCEQHDPWSRIIEVTGLQNTVNREQFLDALNAAAEASGKPLIIFLDAINESRPVSYWRNRLLSFSESIVERPMLRLCVSCRTTYKGICLREDDTEKQSLGPHVYHQAFRYNAIEACRSFCEYYHITPPIVPILPEEYANPLFLKLACETLQTKGMGRLDPIQQSLSVIIKMYLEEKNKQFNEERQTSSTSHVIGKSLKHIVKAIADSGKTSITETEAVNTIPNNISSVAPSDILEWMIHSELLIEDVPIDQGCYGYEKTVRPCYERIGDYLLANEILDRCDPSYINKECMPDGKLYPYLAELQHSPNPFAGEKERDPGLIEMLTMLIPAKYPGKELPDLCDMENVKSKLYRHFVNTLASRTAESITKATRKLVWFLMGDRDLCYDITDELISICWQESFVDVQLLDLRLRKMKMAQRDSFWSWFLLKNYEEEMAVWHLIHSALENDLSRIEPDVALRWSGMLLWFTAAADRRIKDKATRATIEIMKACPKIIVNLIRLFITDDKVDDDVIVERTLLCSYGVLLITRETDVLREVVEVLYKAYSTKPENYDHALIRDHIRCLCMLAKEEGCLHESIDPAFSMKPISKKWSLFYPDDEQAEKWEKQIRFPANEWMSDFYKYTMNCLDPWTTGGEFHGKLFPEKQQQVEAFKQENGNVCVTKQDCAKWILQHITEDFGYVGSGCEVYDAEMIRTHGMGRSNGIHPERIAKKYMWTSLFHIASRLYDQMLRQPDQYRGPAHGKFILLEERKMDPTLSPTTVVDDSEKSAWWNPLRYDINEYKDLTDIQWTRKKVDVPSLADILNLIEKDGQQWIPLTQLISFQDRNYNEGGNRPYRKITISLKSYLIDNTDIDIAIQALDGRNFWGNWLPGETEWLYGFAGEYPFGETFTPFDDSDFQRDELGQLNGKLNISQDSLYCEWEYDCSIEKQPYIMLPSRKFFTKDKLLWSGKDGFRNTDGKIVFFDPSLVEAGPHVFLADYAFLIKWLSENNMCMLWTLSCEKRIIRWERPGETPTKAFSQIAYLGADGIHIDGKRTYFKDCNQKQGISAEKH